MFIMAAMNAARYISKDMEVGALQVVVVVVVVIGGVPLIVAAQISQISRKLQFLRN